MESGRKKEKKKANAVAEGDIHTLEDGARTTAWQILTENDAFVTERDRQRHDHKSV
jgi:hypothetical protein